MNKKLFLASMLFLILFLILSFSLQNQYLLQIDKSKNEFLASHQPSSLVSISKAASYLFEPAIIIVYALIISLMLFIKKFKRDSILFTASMLVGGAFIYILKEIIQRARPENALVLETSSSFPSGHALISVIFFGFFIYLALKNIKLKIYRTILPVIMIIFILVVGVSRLVLNVHWFSDILGGWFAGLFILLASISIGKYISQ